jgi:HD-GYP domain-containing protein (c-di-GMP phosphodiesterase class II)
MQSKKTPVHPAGPLDDHSSYILWDYRQKILRVLLAASGVGVTGLLVINLAQWIRDPFMKWGLFNVVADILGMFACLGLWRLNQRGRTLAAGWGFILLVFASIPASYSFTEWNRAIMIMFLPVVLSGFVIRSQVSLVLAGVTTLLYTIVYYLSGRVFDFDIFALLTLAVMAVGAYLIANVLNKTIRDLVLAYDETIQGWAVILEQRDSETMGHSQRVVHLTLRLALRLGIRDVDLVHIRRGVLLHDIGKMTIPDAILHKPGPLSEQEWEVMRNHPGDARNYLANISYLASALDIPYCHHERWDGSGYPLGLKEEQIPLAARIFAVVDVWDALTTDRPYRKAWSASRALAHVREQSGRHFDPRIVEAFCELIHELVPELACDDVREEYDG